MNVGVVVERASRRYASRVALESTTQSRTYAQVGDRVNRIARALLDAGLKVGDRVLDLQKNSITYVETDLALATAGLCRVALNYRQNPADWARIAADCGARALIYSGNFAGDVASLRDQVQFVYCTDDGGDDRWLDDAIRDAANGPVNVEVRPTDLVSLNYSSGTTGAQKGCRRTHRARLTSLGNMVTDVFAGLPSSEVWCHAAPMTHASGLFVLPLYAFGSRQVILPGFQVDEYVDALTHFGVTGSVLVPTMVARLLERPDLNSSHFATMRCLVYAGAPMPERHIREAYERFTPNLMQMYGMVEAVPPVSILSVDEHRQAITEYPDWLRSAGTVCTTVKVEVRDDAGQVLAAGDIGEVFVGGDNVMDGYWGTAANTEVKAVTDGWLSTGDVGFLTESHRLYLINRKGDMIITGGYNVYPSEIENAIRTLPGVADVVVFGIPNEEWGQVVAAAYVGDGTRELDDAALADHCRQQLAPYKKPRVVRRLDSFPVNSTGKVARAEVVKSVLADL
jgi:acyl-CoA synthetase (AMP-forming)/AMP-acid ligase II